MTSRPWSLARLRSLCEGMETSVDNGAVIVGDCVAATVTETPTITGRVPARGAGREGGARGRRNR